MIWIIKVYQWRVREYADKSVRVFVAVSFSILQLLEKFICNQHVNDPRVRLKDLHELYFYSPSDLLWPSADSHVDTMDSKIEKGKLE